MADGDAPNGKEVNYKDTLNLPKTEFPMRGNLPQNEPKTIEFWQKNSIYNKMIEQNSELFVMPDGPPYANGNLHVGHVLNKVLKDIVIKYKNMSGKQAHFIPGWDCHGLPIELNVTKKLGSKKKDMSDKQIRELCRKEALKWVETQKQQFVRLGIVADWDNPYLTLQPEYEADEIRVLAKILDNGILYRGEKPVYWCPALQTALAAAEIEYQDHNSPSIYVKFFIEQGLEKFGNPDKPVAMVIWTTTPWTIPANYGIALNANFEYGLYDNGNELLVIAKDLKEAVEKDCEIELKEVSTIKGNELEGLKAKHPFMDRDSLVILGDHVSLEAGTGCVHTAPGHGLDDYHVGLQYNLPVHSPIDPAGKYTSDVPQYEGMKIWEANKVIPADLEKSGHLLKLNHVVHSYPHNPRSKTPLIFRATPQWFVRMDDENFNLRELALKTAENDIEYVPDWGAQRLHSMVSNSPDWCLSRQRIWGVPIPVFYCESCEEPLISSEIMNNLADLMESSKQGIEAYHDTDSKELIGNHKCEKCGSGEFRKGQDILDVWFDSGVCHTAVQKRREGLKFPADIYLEGSDQHRGWFQTSLMSSLAAYKQPPYKTLITHGFANDAQGYKMSKSKGNVVDPAKIINKSGAEMLRLWVAYEDYGQDVSIGDEMLKRISETYRRIRNTMRFMLGNLHDFNPGEQVAFADMPQLDQWALTRLNDLTERCTKAYEEYDFYKVYHALNQFFTVELSATYLDVIKDRLYTWKSSGIERRSSQTVIFQLLNSLTGMMAPILSFLGEEVYGYLPGSKQQSVFLSKFPTTNAEWKANAATEAMTPILDIRSQVSKVLEELRTEKVIGSSLDAKVRLTLKEDNFAAIGQYEAEIKEMLIVSQLELVKGEENKVDAGKASGEKCVRCWHYSNDLNTSPKWPNICPKCVEAFA